MSWKRRAHTCTQTTLPIIWKRGWIQVVCFTKDLIFCCYIYWHIFMTCLCCLKHTMFVYFTQTSLSLSLLPYWCSFVLCGSFACSKCQNCAKRGESTTSPRVQIWLLFNKIELHCLGRWKHVRCPGFLSRTFPSLGSTHFHSRRRHCTHSCPLIWRSLWICITYWK